jgi:crotonobetainyl-CoA:carnitine CoA-transferase CaiB-like acyl-CoA transferase
LKLIGREDLIGDARYDTPDARLQREAEVDAIVTGWTRERTKHEAMAQLSAVGVPAGAVLDSMELTRRPARAHRRDLRACLRRLRDPHLAVRYRSGFIGDFREVGIPDREKRIVSYRISTAGEQDTSRRGDP